MLKKVQINVIFEQKSVIWEKVVTKINIYDKILIVERVLTPTFSTGFK